MIILFNSCRSFPSENSLVNSDKGKPQVVSINLNEGYPINQYSNDSIDDLVNSAGKRIISGKTLPLKGTVIRNTNTPRKIIDASPTIKTLLKNVSPVSQSAKIFAYDSTFSKNNRVNPDTSDVYLLNSQGEDVKTGVNIPFKAIKTDCKLSPVVNLLTPEKKDAASYDIEFLDMEQGLSSSYIMALDTDALGNLWIGTLDGGVIRYDGESMFHLGIENGLKTNKIWSILADVHNNIWIGTEDKGVFRYDGDSLTRFCEADGLGNNWIISLFEDSKGNIWFGTNDGGATCFNGSSIINYSKKEGISNIVIFITEDQKGNIWFSSYSEGVFVFDGKSFTQITTENGLANNSIMPILEDAHGKIWIGTWGGGISVFDGKQFTNYTTREGLIDNNINALNEDKDGSIWIGTWEGLSKFDGTSFANFSTSDGLNNNDIRTILSDEYNNVWMGSWGGGLLNFQTNGFRNFTDNEGFSHSHVEAIIQDNQNNLWFGTWNGISKLENNQIQNFSFGTSETGSFGTALTQDSTGNIWIGAENGALFRYNGEQFEQFDELLLTNNQINKIITDSKGNLWIASERTGLIKYDTKQFITYNPENGFTNLIVNDIREDKNGNVWVSAEGSGIAKIAGDSVSFITTREGLNSNSVNVIFEDSNGNLIFGTEDAGLCIFDGTTFTYLTTKEELSSNTIRSVAEDSDNRIWIGTNKGLNLLVRTTDSESEFNVINFGIEDGLKALDFNQHSLFFDNFHRLWMGTGKCLSMLNIDEFTLQPSKQEAYITQVDVNEQFIDFRNPGERLNNWTYHSVLPFLNVPESPTIPFSDNHLTFHFASTNFASNKKVLYSYRIKELEKTWSIPSNTNFADYRNLPPGAKTFEFKVVDPFTDNNVISIYSFKIKPPLYLSAYAIAFYVIVLSVLVVSIIRFRTRTLRQRKNELQKMVNELEVAKDKAEESNRLKTAFLLNLSHEIRTPMNGILGFTNLLQEKGLSTETRNLYIELINKSGNRMLNTVTDLVEISKVQTSQLKVRRSGFMLLKELKNTCKKFDSDYEAKGISLDTSELDNIEDFEVISDQFKITGILERLLDNALKFTKSGNVKITCRYTTNKKDAIEFSVTDTGIGIPASRLKAIFDPFVQADIEDKDVKEGSGLGLAVAKAYADLIEATLSVKSEEGKGSTFTFVLKI